MREEGIFRRVYICKESESRILKNKDKRERGDGRRTDAPTEEMGMFFWPKCTPGVISISKSLTDLSCAVANLRTLLCASRMSFFVCSGTWARALSICCGDSKNDSGVHLSNFWEYFLTA
jgi:hypothetical protein